jgi:hypothetical protein
MDPKTHIFKVALSESLPLQRNKIIM